MELGTLIRLSKEGDCYDGLIAKVIEWRGEDIEVEFINWPVFYGPFQEAYNPPFKGASINVDADDCAAISPLELLAMEAED